VKDHFIPHIVEKMTDRDMFDTLVGLYQSYCVSWQMLLWNKFLTVFMSKTDTLVSYLAKITQLRHRLVAIGMKVEDKEMVPIALNGLAPSWMPFVESVCAHEALRDFLKLWDNLVQEEIRLETCLVQQKGVEVAFIRRMKKGSKKGNEKGKKEEGRFKYKKERLE
jgi:hypothetical protein